MTAARDSMRPSLDAPNLAETAVIRADTITLDPSKYDQEQINLMEERLILLDNDDRAIGEGSKKDCALQADSTFPASVLKLDLAQATLSRQPVPPRPAPHSTAPSPSSSSTRRPASFSCNVVQTRRLLFLKCGPTPAARTL